MKVALAQFDPVIGDVGRNARGVRECIASAEAHGVDLVAFNEMALVGYPARDLLQNLELVAENVAAVEALAEDCRNVASLVGFVRPALAGPGAPLEDAAALLANGRIQDVHVKSLLPNYGAYDDPRYFRPGPGPKCSEVNGHRFGVAICEDLWDATALGRQLYDEDPVARLMADGAQTIVNIAASGYEQGKVHRREALLARQARRSGAVILYVNQVGGNDGMIFDGSSCAFSSTGRLLARAASFGEDLLFVDTQTRVGRCEPVADEMTRLAEAIKLGLRDYLRKGGFDGVVLGLAGDLCSAVVATLAADGLGPEKVRCLVMPIGPDRDVTVNQCKQLAGNLRIHLDVLSIEPAVRLTKALVESASSRGPEDVLTTGIPACLHATMLSVLSAINGHLPLVALNKTDLSLGCWVPAPGVCGGLAPLGDVFRRDITGLAEHLNAQEKRIPPEIISAWQIPQRCIVPQAGEPLWLDDGLDEILARHLEQGQTARQMARDGFDFESVRRTLRHVGRAEHWRRQAPMVLEVSARAFGPGWRLPVTRGDL